MIVRTEEGEAEPPPEAAPETAPETLEEGEPEPLAAQAAVQDTNLVLDAETLPALAEALLGTDVFQSVFKPLLHGLTSLGERVDAAVASLTQAQDEALEPVRSRLEKLEQTDEEKQKEWKNDLPAKRQISVTYRAPGRGDDPPAQKTYAETAEDTVTAIKGGA